MKTVLELEDLANKAVKAALNQQWDDALLLNQEILADSPENVEAANRLARAYQELGNSAEAANAYKRVLELDPFNTIAQKNLDKLKSGVGANSQRKVSQELFLEEPGKTRSVVLSNPNTKAISNYSSGEELQLEEKDGMLAVVSHKNEVLGYLPDEIGNHLLKLIQLGNTYSAHLMTASDELHVFLRETHQASAAAKYVSFNRSTVSASGSLSTPRSLRRSISTDEDLSHPDDSDEPWDADDEDSSDADDADDLTVSLESLQDEEDQAYGKADRY